MSLAYVDKLGIDNNSVKYLLLRQDVFDRTVDAREMKIKNSEETFRAFLDKIRKKINPKKFESKSERNFAESLKNFAKLKEQKFTLE